MVTVSKSALAALSTWEVTSALVRNSFEALSLLGELNYSGRQVIPGPKAISQSMNLQDEQVKNLLLGLNQLVGYLMKKIKRTIKTMLINQHCQ